MIKFVQYAYESKHCMLDCCRVFSKFEKHLPQQIQRMARAYMDQSSSHCSKKYACYLVDDNAISKSS